MHCSAAAIARRQQHHSPRRAVGRLSPASREEAARSAARRGTGSGSAGWFPQRDCSAATSTWRRQHHTPRRAGGKSIERAAGFGFWRHAAPRPLLGWGGARVRGQREGEQPEQRTSLHLGHQYRTQRGWPSRETPEHPTEVTYGGRDTARCRLAATGAPATGAPDGQHPRSLAISPWRPSATAPAACTQFRPLAFRSVCTVTPDVVVAW